MKVRQTVPYLVHPQNTDMIYRSVLCYTEQLKALRQWVDKSPLGTGTDAVANIDEEIKHYTQLSLAIYETCFSSGLGLDHPVEYTHQPTKLTPELLTALNVIRSNNEEQS